MWNRPSVRTTTGQSNTRTGRCRRKPRTGSSRRSRARRDRSAARVLSDGDDRRTDPMQPVRSWLRPDPVFAKRLMISQELWRRLQVKQLKPGLMIVLRAASTPVPQRRALRHGKYVAASTTCAITRGRGTVDPGAAGQATRGAETPPQAYSRRQLHVARVSRSMGSTTTHRHPGFRPPSSTLTSAFARASSHCRPAL